MLYNLYIQINVLQIKYKKYFKQLFYLIIFYSNKILNEFYSSNICNKLFFKNCLNKVYYNNNCENITKLLNFINTNLSFLKIARVSHFC